MKKILYFLPILFSLVIFTGCEEEENNSPDAPTGCFECSDNIFVGLSSQFDASCSDGATSYNWDFGDGGIASDSIATHTFNKAGDHKVTLTVSNDDGSDVITKTVTVQGNKLVEVSNDINSDITWKKDSVYIITGDIRVYAVLTIEAGTVVKFKEGTFMDCDEGKIVARGTELLPVIFTSLRDDSFGGDSNSDGEGTSPAKGDWDFIAIAGTNNASEFDYCKFFYGGGYTEYMDYTLSLESATTSVTNCTFAHNVGLTQGALSAKEAGDVTITGNIFYDNEIPLGINGKFDLDNSNSFHNPEDATETNTHNGVFVTGTYEGIKGNRIWGETKVPMVMKDGSSDLKIESGNSLTIAPGVTVKMGEEFSIYVNEGVLIAEGTESAPIIFTSIHDDSKGGDTDANGSTVSAMPGDWDNIRVNGTNNNTIFKYCQFYYGGGYSEYQDQTLYIQTNNTTLDHCVIAYNKGDSYGAVNLEDASYDTKVTNNIFYGNEKPMLISGNLDIDHTNVFHNPSDQSETNAKNGIFVSDNRIRGNINWSVTEVPYVMIIDLIIEDGNFLTLAENVIVKFDTGIYLRYSGSNISGHDGSGVYFTSYKDDSKGGDTNGDGTSTSATTGDWTGIINATTSDYESWPNILYSEN